MHKPAISNCPFSITTQEVVDVEKLLRMLFSKRLFKNVSRVEEVKSALLFSSCVVVILSVDGIFHLNFVVVLPMAKKGIFSSVLLSSWDSKDNQTWKIRKIAYLLRVIELQLQKPPPNWHNNVKCKVTQSKFTPNVEWKSALLYPTIVSFEMKAIFEALRHRVEKRKIWTKAWRIT